ncbi:MAG TPA: RDD family protein [Acidimicrobiales bacterium]|jgi:uncharacterized RDD family membrane protein YckC
MDRTFAEPSMPYAGFWWRALGFVIDSVVLIVVVELPLRSLHLSTVESALTRAAFAFIYGAAFLIFNRGRTLGMLTVGIRVVSISGEGVSARRAALRTLGYVILASIVSFYHVEHFVHPTPQQSKTATRQASILFSLGIPLYLDLLWMLWDKKKQTLHDKLAGTIVIRSTSEVAEAPSH